MQGTRGFRRKCLFCRKVPFPPCRDRNQPTSHSLPCPAAGCPASDLCNSSSCSLHSLSAAEHKPVDDVVFVEEFESKQDTGSVEAAALLREDVIVNVSHQISSHTANRATLPLTQSLCTQTCIPSRRTRVPVFGSSRTDSRGMGDERARPPERR